MSRHQFFLSLHPSGNLQQSRRERIYHSAGSLQECLYWYRQDQEASHFDRIRQQHQAHGFNQRPYSQTRIGKRCFLDVLLSPWHLFHRLGTSSQVRPQRRFYLLYPKQDRATSLHPMGERDAGYTPRPPHRYVSAPSNPQKWTMPMPKY